MKAKSKAKRAQKRRALGSNVFQGGDVGRGSLKADVLSAFLAAVGTAICRDLECYGDMPGEVVTEKMRECKHVASLEFSISTRRVKAKRQKVRGEVLEFPEHVACEVVTRCKACKLHLVGQLNFADAEFLSA